MEETVTATTSALTRSLDIEAIFLRLYEFLVGLEGGVHVTDWTTTLTAWWIVITIFSYLYSLAVVALLVYLSIRQHQIEEEDADKYDYLPKEEAEDTTEHSRWKHINELIESATPSDWRQAIIEADIMLDDVLGSYGYPGDTVGEKLKAGDPERFRTLQDAWDAHKVRNEIAHSGSAYPLSEQIAHRTIAKYRNVFLEFQVIQ